MVLLLVNKAYHIQFQTHGHVLPALLKHVHAVADKITYALAGSPPQTVILTDCSLQLDQGSGSGSCNDSGSSSGSGSGVG